MTLGRICNRETIVARRETSLTEAAQLMRAHHVGDLVIIEEKNGRSVPVGILTDRDLVIEILARDVDPTTVTAGDAMSDRLVTAHETESLFEALQRMRVQGVRRMPVVDAEGGLVGIVAADDFLDLLAEEMAALAHLVTREQAREKTRRQ